ncbi:hypothetical protein EVAR_15977_1 [Eumeta japonica]|uniref:Uncharacterized protein n=1 Tax=Eumeta variegata TaxID=151549 RepID=A0A4C1UMU5_EUMVA|nr:hypothetical protein EVAR_15977_1 [Eumeta japonica]
MSDKDDARNFAAVKFVRKAPQRQKIETRRGKRKGSLCRSRHKDWDQGSYIAKRVVSWDTSIVSPRRRIHITVWSVTTCAFVFVTDRAPKKKLRWRRSALTSPRRSRQTRRREVISSRRSLWHSKEPVAARLSLVFI